MRSLPSSCILLLSTSLFAQQPSPPPASAKSPAAPASADTLAAAKQRLAQALQKTGSMVDTAFTAEWGPNGAQNNAAQAFLTNQGTSKVTGSWHRDRLHATFAGDQGDEIVCCGRRRIAKDGNSEWKLRAGRFADGNSTGFVPDPAPLLQLLAAADLPVKRATVGTLDDRPIEIVTVELPADVVTDATWSGLLPDGNAWSGQVMMFQVGGAGAGQGGRAAAPPPTATVDLAVCIDPATDTVHELRFRWWAQAGARAFRQVVLGGARGGVVQVAAGGPPAAQEEGDDEKPGKADAPADGSTMDDAGLPIRSRKNVSVSDCTIRLRDHGKKQAPPLDDAQKKLLGL